MLRTQLKSKIHLACVTDANLNYEGSITVPEDVMKAVDLWAGEKVLIVCRDTGARLETYVQPGPVGSAAFVINGAAARLIGAGDRITLMSFCQAEKPVEAYRILCNEQNDIVRSERGIKKVSIPQQTISF
jgi:aspartate 1-decarboxylase